MIPFPNKKYDIIYADPPWQYKRNGGKSAESKYEVMTIDAIKNLPVNNIAEDNSHLYMWVTNPFISEGLEVCKSWGFEYKTLLTWVKTYKDGSPVMGMGYYFRGATEHINCVKDMIINCSGDLPRIELFAREESEGWDCWGNDTKKFNKRYNQKSFLNSSELAFT